MLSKASIESLIESIDEVIFSIQVREIFPGCLDDFSKQEIEELEKLKEYIERLEVS